MSVFCSTIIPTVNRPTLSRAVRSVLDQDLSAADFEVIVVNDSRAPLPRMDWQSSPRVRVIDTNGRERCVARNTGAAVATGEYLHFLDDDDWLLPGALAAFWDLARTCGRDVVWLHGSYQTVDNDGVVVAEFHPGLNGNVFALLVAGEGVPLQVSLVSSRQFFAVGGFDPRTDVLGVEDRDLGRRLALVGEIAHTPSLVARIRIGEVGSTTNWAVLAEGDRRGREKALAAPGAFGRLRASAPSSRLRGRVTRAYCASAAWNLKRKGLLTALSRAGCAALCAGPHVVSPGFWRGLRTAIK